MASNMSSFFTSLFLLLLIFIQGIIPCIHGRPLNLGESNELHLNETKIVGNFNADIQAEIGTNEESFAIASPSDGVNTGVSPPPPPGHDTSDFRPTAPRHSPGIGHSVHN
ncbi:hypothetical protein TIFTF001_002660 [Ficus carica]|uniref:Transmembrane protein n=1 Tax=Ficus carica TaxID=3494 RepID=A0AA87Z5R7_FICCA|nr:hypothetical protein TIFTF001_002660 [Ficus carica]